MTTGQRIRFYLNDMGWELVDLARATNIHFITLEAAINDDGLLTRSQLMMIINKIVMEYPRDRHWEIFQTIAIQPTFDNGQNK